MLCEPYLVLLYNAIFGSLKYRGMLGHGQFVGRSVQLIRNVLKNL